MKTVLLFFTLIPSMVLQAYHPPEQKTTEPGNSIEGKWIRFSPMGPISLTFHSNGVVEGDLGNDQSIEIVSEYSLEDDMIRFTDKEGIACPEKGAYRIRINPYYISFDFLSDNCGGRVRSTMGFWVRPDYEADLKTLGEKISGDPIPEDYLHRGRIYLAIGKSYEAKQDFDTYIASDPKHVMALINRASARFPVDLEGVVEDCTRAIELDPETRNAYFMRGLARYDLGETEAACMDFYKAIALGFRILEEAEGPKCAEIWKRYANE